MSEVEWAGMRVDAATAETLPSWADTVAYLRSGRAPSAVAALRAARDTGRPIVQPRCGVGDHGDMLRLLHRLREAGPGMLTVTIDSYTRLRQFDRAARALREAPADLNGYPLVAHGWRRGRELIEAVDVPVEIRHGSPDPRELFAVSLAAGAGSFEGGGIGYNLPYCKDVPLRTSMECWREVDALCGRLAAAGVTVDRELFGTLTAVLMPPSISLAVTLLEARAAAAEGVRCLSIAYPQGGEIHQDVAALRCIRLLAGRYLPAGVEVHPVLHEFMGVFPRRRDTADALILYGGVTALLGGASKVINKTRQEGYGIPDADANADGIRTALLGTSDLLDVVRIDEDRVGEETHWLLREVTELVEPVLAEPDLPAAVAGAFAGGRLDVPFSASVHARSWVVPARDARGAIRYRRTGRLPFSTGTLHRNATELGPERPTADLVESVTADINYFLRRDHAPA
ncbi:methylaspartate mutase [Catenuloplanes indicus]|uniref:Methylaspartate mutase epsilon subunit n=1 Tax=Catenuloplanes indicus TaxID=137267 RepID=A0AAE3VVE8_9ACTN|nr:methylaspartate mutase [Catenuloplanes indicus]MDQ0363922.1 methylaspartate mutase epsilon subunit [Catenuloplanes indicus]